MKHLIAVVKKLFDCAELTSVPLHPENILVLDNYRVEMLNMVDETHEDAEQRDYVSLYKAPELQILDGSITPASQIYALGCILYEMSTVACPGAENLKKIKANSAITDACPIPSGRLSGDLRQLVARMMSKYVSKRPTY